MSHYKQAQVFTIKTVNSPATRHVQITFKCTAKITSYGQNWTPVRPLRRWHTNSAPPSTGKRNASPRKIQTITPIVFRVKHSLHEVYNMNIRLEDI